MAIKTEHDNYEDEHPPQYFDVEPVDDFILTNQVDCKFDELLEEVDGLEIKLSSIEFPKWEFSESDCEDKQKSFKSTSL